MRLISTLLVGLAPMLALGLASGCTVEAPSAIPDKSSTGSHPDMGPGAGNNADLLPPDDGKVSPPSLDAPIRSTSFLSVPIHGMAKPNASVIIAGTADGTIAAEVASDGRFCADVKLSANRSNVLTLRTIDPLGTQSDPISLSIQQTGTAAPAPTSPTSQNAALGGSGSNNGMWAYRNDETAMMDGDPENAFGGRHKPFSDNAIATVRLADRSRIERIKIRAPSDCPFDAPFDVYFSNADAPSNPITQPMAWSKLTTSIANPTTANISLASAIIVTHVSVVWPYDGWSSAGLNCGSWVLGPYYAIGELEAWTVPNTAPPPPSAPSCSGGG